MFRVRKNDTFSTSLVRLTQTTKWIRFNFTSRLFTICRQFSTKLTHYDVLDVPKDATSQEIREAFIKKSKECHPDMNRKDQSNHKRFILVNEAYGILSKPLLRRDYDAAIAYHKVHGQSTSESDQQYNYSPPRYYDEQIRKAMEFRDEDNKRRAAGGEAGYRRVSNLKVVAICCVWILTGIATHYFVVSKTSMLHIKSLDERDARIHETFVKAKTQAEINTPEEQLRILLEKQEENRARRLKLPK